MFETALTTQQFIDAILQTVIMVSVSLIIGSILGVIIAITLVLTREDGILPHKMIYRILNGIINIVRSLPFIILLVSIIPFTKLIVGTAIGTLGALVPLIVYIAPYIARLIENSLLEVSSGIVEAAKSMGANVFQIIWYFLLPEAKSSLILSLTTATIGLISATAMAGAVGGGGIGDLALNYGYQRFDNIAMLYTVMTLIIIVQSIQSIGNFLAKKTRFH